MPATTLPTPVAPVSASFGPPDEVLEEVLASLTIKRRRFLRHYLATGNQREAVRVAGYNCTTPQSETSRSIRLASSQVIPRNVRFRNRALKWGDVELSRGRLRVRAGRYRGHEGSPKTESSVRDVDLLPPVVEALVAHRAAQAAARLAAGQGVPDPQHLLGNQTLEPFQRRPLAFRSHSRSASSRACLNVFPWRSAWLLVAALRALHRRVWAPIVAALPPGTTTVVLSPDGQLNFVSFATLLGPDDRFVAADYSVRYVASGRDLLRTPASRPAAPGLAVFANPDFAGGHGPSRVPAEEIQLVLDSAETRDMEALRLPPLPGTDREATALASIAAQSRWALERREGDDATETNLRAVRSPWVLHLATHGFFLESGPVASRGAEAGGRGIGGVRPVASVEPNGSHAHLSLSPVALTDPMHRSGLALAGAQTTLAEWAQGRVPPTESDGIVTAAEAGELQLGGTWLVTLSACDSGTGTARAGEGVLGLRRAFLQAGAQNLLLTLWPVADEVTADLMRDFYESALRSGNAPQALAEVQRDWLVRVRAERGVAQAVTIAGPFILSSQGPVQ